MYPVMRQNKTKKLSNFHIKNISQRSKDLLYKLALDHDSSISEQIRIAIRDRLHNYFPNEPIE